jgi:hypothetical protein
LLVEKRKMMDREIRRERERPIRCSLTFHYYFRISHLKFESLRRVREIIERKREGEREEEEEREREKRAPLLNERPKVSTLRF